MKLVFQSEFMILEFHSWKCNFLFLIFWKLCWWLYLLNLSFYVDHSFPPFTSTWNLHVVFKRQSNLLYVIFNYKSCPYSITKIHPCLQRTPVFRKTETQRHNHCDVECMLQQRMRGWSVRIHRGLTTLGGYIWKHEPVWAKGQSRKGLLSHQEQHV